MSWLSRTPSIETSSFNRVPGMPTDSMGVDARKSDNSKWITCLNLLKRQQAEQYPVQDVGTMDRVVHDSLAVHLNLHLRYAGGEHRVGGVEIDRANDAAHHDGLVFRVHVQFLGTFDHQISVHENVRYARGHGSGQGSLPAGGAFAIKGCSRP